MAAEQRKISELDVDGDPADSKRRYDSGMD